MSVCFDWKILSGAEVKDGVKDYLNSALGEFNFPPFLKKLRVLDMYFGKSPPKIIIEEICDPLAEFYFPVELDFELTKSDKSSKSGSGSNKGVSDIAEYTNEASSKEGNDKSSVFKVDQSPFDPKLLEGYWTDNFEFNSFLKRLSDAENKGPKTGHSFNSAPDIDCGANNETMKNADLDLSTKKSLSDNSINVRNTTTDDLCPPSIRSQQLNQSLNYEDIDILSLSPSSRANKDKFPQLCGNKDYDYDDKSKANETTSQEHYSYQDYNSKISYQDETIAASFLDAVRDENDFQVEVYVNYDGDMELFLSVDISDSLHDIISLPLKLKLSNISFEGIIIIAFIGDRINLCFKDSVFKGDHILRNMDVKSEIGDECGNVLKNIDKIGEFVVSIIRKVIDARLIFPKSYSFIIS